MCAKALRDATDAGRAEGRRRDRYGGDCPHDHTAPTLRRAWFDGFSEGRAASRPGLAAPAVSSRPTGGATAQRAGDYLVG